MKGLAVCFEGVENIAAKEIEEIIGVKAEAKKNSVVFEIEELDDLCLLSYKAQSVNKILLLMGNFEIKEIEELKKIEEIDFSDFMEGKRFAVRTLVLDDLNSQEVASETGRYIDGKVNLDRPDVVVFNLIVEGMCYIGIDFSGDISKRGYKNFSHYSDLKGPIAYSLLRKVGFTGKESLLDPFCSNGTIVLEAGYMGGKIPITYFEREEFPFLKFMDYDFEEKKEVEKLKIFGIDDQLKNIRAASANAKIGGIDNAVEFSKAEVDMVDTLFKKKEIDLIASNPPRLSKKVDEKRLERLYKEFFHQAEYVLKGKIGLISDERTAEFFRKIGSEYFKVEEEHDVKQGKEVLKIVVFGKG
ncbi:hypothetical protein GF336_05730 [Candidatus Woesearchaeota archaeon]|nr:hypothetical protein [Candidatus Woesearchaeota archaeon]